jgi:hypothetical protein
MLITRRLRRPARRFLGKPHITDYIKLSRRALLRRIKWHLTDCSGADLAAEVKRAPMGGKSQAGVVFALRKENNEEQSYTLLAETWLARNVRVVGMNASKVA